MNVAVLAGNTSELQLESVIQPRFYRMLRPVEVRERTTLSSTQISRLHTQGRFPSYARLGTRACGVPEHELDAFFAARMAARAGLPPLGFRPPLPRWHYRPELVPERSGIRLLRLREVAERVRLGTSTIYRLIPSGAFPAPVSLGERASRWVAHEVEDWICAGSPGAPPPPALSAPPAALRMSALPSVA